MTPTGPRSATTPMAADVGRRAPCRVIAGMWRRLWQGHLPLAQIAGLGRALQWLHLAGRLVRHAGGHITTPCRGGAGGVAESRQPCPRQAAVSHRGLPLLV